MDNIYIMIKHELKNCRLMPNAYAAWQCGMKRILIAAACMFWGMGTFGCASSSGSKEVVSAGSSGGGGKVSQERDPSRIYGDPELNEAYSDWADAGYPKHSASRKYDLDGKATWYGPGLNGNKTASGEVFDMYGMTAAHRKLPFGSIVLVTNEENGKSVVVRINDRGPFTSGRVIDLSYGAAYLVDMIRAGVVECSIDIIRLGYDGYAE